MKNKFISFEGIEGSGKSSQTKILFNNLVQRNIDAILTREPGGVKASEQIREILIHQKLENISEIFLNFAARIEHVEKLIKPAINLGKIVICDRFFDSTLAYQGYGFGGDLHLIQNVQKMAIGNFAPDITFLIDLPVEEAFKRVEKRADNNKYEKLSVEFHQKVRTGFLKIAKENSARIKIIDGTKNIEAISQEILDILQIV